MIHMKMRPDIHGNGNEDNYTCLADNYWWKYIYKLNTFCPWNNRVFFLYIILIVLKKDILNYLKTLLCTIDHSWLREWQ